MGAGTAVALVAVLAAVLVALAAPQLRAGERAVQGFWVGDSGFMREAGLTELYLYLGAPEPEGGRIRRAGYLVMGSEGEILSNQAVTLDYGGSVRRWWSVLRGSVAGGGAYRVKHCGCSFGTAAVFPAELSLALDLTRGTLRLHDGERVWAQFFKDTETSATLEAQDGAGAFQTP